MQSPRSLAVACSRAVATAMLGAAGALPAVAQTPDAAPGVDAAWTARVEALATQAAQAAVGGRPGVRVEVVPGTLDPRLKLAPCARVDIYLPPGQRAWGATRVGLRCADGPVAWNVYMPLTVKVIAPALVAVQPLAAGTVVEPSHLQVGEADWAAVESPVVASADLAVGRTLARALHAGAALRDADLKKRQWFAVGDPVRVLATGRGFSVGAEAVALTPGFEGQSVRVRTESGRTLTGMAVGERRVEVPL